MDYGSDTSPFDVAAYREMQKGLPGAEALYRLVRAVWETALPDGGELLIVGAGGGREIEALGECETPFRATAVDPSAKMLDAARFYAAKAGAEDRIEFIEGTVEDVPLAPRFDAATSLLVMHFLADNGAKSDFLKQLRARLKPGATLVHADVCLEDPAAFEAYRPLFLRQAALAGLSEDKAALGPAIIADMPIVDTKRVAALMKDAGFGPPRSLFSALWYHAVVTEAV